MPDLLQAWLAGREACRENRGIPTTPFGEACESMNSPNDLLLTEGASADTADMAAWGLTPEEWAFGLGEGYEALTMTDEE